MNPNIFRPSSLPKLAECIHYEPLPGEPSDAAARGSRIDAMFRELLQGRAPEGDAEELDVANRAAQTVRLIAGDAKMLTSEEDCKLELVADSFEKIITGTADVIIPDKRLLIDLKTGGVRNYREQMAAYALACTSRFRADEWTAILVFADQLETVEMTFTRDEAQSIVHGLRERWLNRGAVAPAECDYCGWCAKGIAGDSSCPVVQRKLQPFAATLGLGADLSALTERLLSDAELAGRFKSAMKLAAKLEEAIDAKAKDGSGWVPEGYKLQQRSGRLTFNSTHISQVARDIGTAKVFECCKVDPSKLKKAIEEHGEETAARYADCFSMGPKYYALVEEKKCNK